MHHANPLGNHQVGFLVPGKPELQTALQHVLTHWGQPATENDIKMLLKHVLDGCPTLPKIPGMPANKGTSEFTLAKGLLAIERWHQPTDQKELCFCFPVTSVCMSGCSCTHEGRFCTSHSCALLQLMQLLHQMPEVPRLNF